MRNRLNRIRESHLVRDTSWVMAGQGMRFVLQAGYFIMLARVLGAYQFGVFAGASAFAALAAPFSSLGAHMLFMRYVKADPEQFARYWGNILLSAVAANVVLVTALWATAAHFLSPASAAVIIPVALANGLFGQLIQGVVVIFQTYLMMRHMALWSSILNALRFVAVAVMMLVLHHATAGQWAWVSALLALIIAAMAIATVIVRFGSPRLEPRLLITSVGEGLLYSMSGSSASAYNDLDKTLLSHYRMNVANGLYTAAYRIIDVATIPVTSLESASLPRFFEMAKDNVSAAVRFAWRVMGRATLLGAGAGVAAFLFAPLIPILLGHAFAQSALVLRWLCLIPVFRAVHQITGAALTGTGHQAYRTGAQIAVTLLNLGLNLIWIPAYGWHGAAWASLITDGTLGVLCWSTLAWIGHRASKPSSGSAVHNA
jgi:O-antigen/teichoic acid export membrane protein